MTDPVDKQIENSTENNGQPKSNVKGLKGFQKGVSGNPAGRKPNGNAWADIYNEILDSKEISLVLTKKVTKTVEGKEKTTTEEINVKLTSQNTMRYALGIAMLQAGLKGDTKAVKELADRTVGRAQVFIKSDVPLNFFISNQFIPDDQTPDNTDNVQS